MLAIISMSSVVSEISNQLISTHMLTKCIIKENSLST